MNDHLAPGNFYAIRVKETLLPGTVNWFNNLTVTHLPEGGTRLVGWFPDQPALRGILEQIWDLNMTLQSLEQITDGDDENPLPSEREK